MISGKGGEGRGEDIREGRRVKGIGEGE